MTPIRADAAAIAEAAGAICRGDLVIMPTETVYGLACDATNPSAVARVFAAKGRPSFNPLIAHVLDLPAALRQARLHPLARRLAEKFWPGPLTLVGPRQADSDICELASAGLKSVALRAPAHPVARALIEASGKPIAAPSANLSGRLSPTHAAHAAEDLGDAAAFILDAGPCALGLESTVIAVDDEGHATLLRWGAITRADVEAEIGPVSVAGETSTPAAPGMLLSHYAPRARIRLDVASPSADEAYLSFGPVARPEWLNLSPTGDLVEAAANLFAYLRRLDSSGVGTIAVAPIPRHGIGEAINDRLSRAAAGR